MCIHSATPLMVVHRGETLLHYTGLYGNRLSFEVLSHRANRPKTDSLGLRVTVNNLHSQRQQTKEGEWGSPLDPKTDTVLLYGAFPNTKRSNANTIRFAFQITTRPNTHCLAKETRHVLYPPGLPPAASTSTSGYGRALLVLVSAGGRIIR